MATRILSAHLTKKDKLKIKFQQTARTGRQGINEPYSSVSTDNPDLEVHRHLKDALFRLVPHTMFSTGFADHKVAIPTSIDDKKWFDDGHFEDDERFSSIEVTGVEFIGKTAIDGIKIHAVKKNDKEENTKFKTPVIYLDRNVEGAYPLVAILIAQIETLIFEIDAYMEGKNANSNQLSLWDNMKVA